MKREEPKVLDSFTASNGITIEWAPDPSVVIPELTEEDFKNARPFPEAEPEFYAALMEMREVRGRGRPKVEQPRKMMGFRLSAALTEAIKATGKGYNRRVENVLREALAQGKI